VQQPRSPYRVLAALIAVYVVFAALYSLNTPLFEAPDEYYHFAVIRHLAATGQLPPRENSDAHPWRQMAFHAPLYHLSAALLIAPIDTSDSLTRYPLNPHAQIGEPGAEHNHNFIAHTGDPWRRTGLAARIVRLWSVILGGVTVIAVYVLGQEVFPRRPHLAPLAALTVVINPQFLFLAGSINNDNLVIALSTVALALTARLVRRGIDARRITLLALILAAASLAKSSGLALYPPVIVAGLGVCWRDRVPLRRMALYAAIGLSAWALIAGWWVYGNWRDYGDPTAARMVAEATQLRAGPVDWIGELRGLYYSFWALFGWFNLPAPAAFYAWVTITLIAAVAGLAIAMITNTRWRRDDLLLAAVLLSHTAAVIGGWAQFNTLVLAGQGRLWFPTLSALGCALAAGLSAWHIRLAALTLLAGIGLGTVAFPFTLLRAAYAPTPQMAVEAWARPADAVGFPIREPWNDRACVVLWLRPASEDAESVTIDYAWESRCQMTGYWSVFVHISALDRETCATGDTAHIAAQFDSMPDGGNTPVPALRPGHVLIDRITVPRPAALSSGGRWAAQTGLYDAGGTFIRALITPDADQELPDTEAVFVGRCSPELINLRLKESE
jgi:hypothetical protein